MTKTNWNKTLEEVLKHKTEPTEMISPRTGKPYTTDVIPTLKVVSIGTWEESEDKRKYSVIDPNNNLEYSIKAPQKIEVKLGNILVFKNVRGGNTKNGVGWLAADSVSIVPSHA
ncbi:hypothetical protein [Facklamia hominis]|uniref:hypothetical protein n=1 Tax=Facklamia hominis TaxID=178214 RepID=UPI00101BC2B4|nr:hypothetical protein [Facklamia hominis]RYC98127.1 hypothetical protein EKN08_04925 [Facklamia hominis]